MHAQAARTYIVLDAMLKEKARQNEIKEAKRQIEEANQAIKDLKA